MAKATRPVGTPEPGGDPFTDEYGLLISGGTLARLGRHKEALPITAASVEKYSAQENPPYESYGNAYLAHARALLGADPAEAARATMCALDVIDGRPTHTVLHRADELCRLMGPYSGVGAVSALRERLTETVQPALPPAVNT